MKKIAPGCLISDRWTLRIHFGSDDILAKSIFSHLPVPEKIKFTSLREAEGIGRPLGTAGFVTELERRLGRPIARRAPGRKAVAIPVGEQLNLLQ